MLRFCETVERRRAEGLSLHKAMRGFVARRGAWKARRRRPAKFFSRGGLIRIYYRWVNCGKAPEALLQHWCYAGPVDSEALRAFIQAAAHPGVRSVAGACKTVDLTQASPHRIFKALPAGVVLKIKAAFRERRQAEVLPRQAKRRLRAELAGLRMAEQVRSRRIRALYKETRGGARRI